MQSENLISSLASFAPTLIQLVQGISDEDAHWKPASGNWSITEIVCHLGDEERDDFRKRLQLTLERPGEPWPGIDPVARAVAAKYTEQKLGDKVLEFVAERTASIQWLRGLKSPDWQAAYEHPILGVIKAGDLLAAWAAHDQLHTRQIAKRKFELIQRDASSFTTSYAGVW